ncbi:MAG: SpoIIE family protein phosphatase [Chloroflexi bacterium]|nr:SpoIIE family protein phosphatase [Chloroflexota bacterium]MCI0579941.1 SpoIIE family protein phosphatase [Chloroflexota bacterium]MCI0646524.1 SpoIIE family protein phosphatase [Chloroflexota bacterium]MCI0726124.1 SpoIIE family protein phosphatase [Chloroflexota bacterium]
MLDLKDFNYLPSLDAAIGQLVSDGPGLVVVAGLDPRPHGTPGGQEEILPSGRATIFRILVRRLLPESPQRGSRRERAIVIAASRDAVRLPRALRYQVTIHLVNKAHSYEDSIRAASLLRPDLLVVDTLNEETTALVLEAAQSGLKVLSQIDTIFHGADVARRLLELGASRELLAALRWVVTVQRLATLCPHCKQPVAAEAVDWPALQRRYPALPGLESNVFYRSAGCVHCAGTGWLGEAAAFDVYRADGKDPLEGASLLPLEQYVFELATAGQVALDDLLRLETAQVRQTYQLLLTSEQALSEANLALQRRLAQLEAANKVLQERTEALVSLHEVSQTLLSAAGLAEQAQRVCIQCCALSGADRAVLYYLNSPDTAQVLASYGWDLARVPARVEARLLNLTAGQSEAEPFKSPPPGIPFGHPDREGAELRAGLRVPLMTDGRPVGLLVVHTIRKSGFGPGEVALLQTFANQAALAIQRAGLLEQLQAKVAALEAAQVGLAQKERLERELELARQVQQRMLPHTFPHIPGFHFATLNRPARHVGGDFYDVIALDDDYFGVAVADVSDKGMPAALYMALTRSLLLAEARRTCSPGDVLRAVNDLLLRLGEPDMFVTVFYGVVERGTRRFIYGRAGHDRPFLLRDGDVLELDGQGLVLGLLGNERLHLEEVELELRPGDRLVLYSDGLTDVVAADGQMYDRRQFQALLRQHATLPPDALCRAVFEALQTYQGAAEQYDDMTLLVVGVE